MMVESKIVPFLKLLSNTVQDNYIVYVLLKYYAEVERERGEIKAVSDEK